MALSSLILLGGAYAASMEEQSLLLQKLQQMSAKKQTPEALGQAVAVGSLVSCTNKTAGTKAVEAFYQQLKALKQSAKAACAQGQSAQVRALVLSSLEQNKHHPVLQALLGCYDAQAASLAPLAGAKAAGDAARYARWLHNPELAQQELSEGEVCKGTPVTSKPAASSL